MSTVYELIKLADIAGLLTLTFLISLPLKVVYLIQIIGLLPFQVNLFKAMYECTAGPCSCCNMLFLNGQRHVSKCCFVRDLRKRKNW